MTIGGWPLTLERGDAGRRVRQTLSQREGVDCRMEGRGKLVVVTQTPSGDGSIDRMRGLLAHRPGVLRSDLVARFEDEAPAACAS